MWLLAGIKHNSPVSLGDQNVIHKIWAPTSEGSQGQQSHVGPDGGGRRLRAGMQVLGRCKRRSW